VPRVGAFNDPASRSASHATDERSFTTTPDVRLDASRPNLVFDVIVVVGLVEAYMSRSPRAPRRSHHHSVERWRAQPLVVDIGARDLHAERHAATIDQNMTFDAQLAAVSRVSAGVVPLLAT
jgi:hypothetical protein